MSTVFRSVKLLFLPCIASGAGFFFKQKKLQNAVFVFFPAWLVMTEKKKKKTQIRQSQNKHLRNKLLYS